MAQPARNASSSLLEPALEAMGTRLALALERYFDLAHSSGRGICTSLMHQIRKAEEVMGISKSDREGRNSCLLDGLAAFHQQDLKKVHVRARAALAALELQKEELLRRVGLVEQRHAALGALNLASVESCFSSVRTLVDTQQSRMRQLEAELVAQAEAANTARDEVKVLVIKNGELASQARAADEACTCAKFTMMQLTQRHDFQLKDAQEACQKAKEAAEALQEERRRESIECNILLTELVLAESDRCAGGKHPEWHGNSTCAALGHSLGVHVNVSTNQVMGCSRTIGTLAFDIAVSQSDTEASNECTGDEAEVMQIHGRSPIAEEHAPVQGILYTTCDGKPPRPVHDVDHRLTDGPDGEDSDATCITTQQNEGCRDLASGLDEGLTRASCDEARGIVVAMEECVPGSNDACLLPSQPRPGVAEVLGCKELETPTSHAPDQNLNVLAAFAASRLPIANNSDKTPADVLKADFKPCAEVSFEPTPEHDNARAILNSLHVCSQQLDSLGLTLTNMHMDPQSGQPNARQSQSGPKPSHGNRLAMAPPVCPIDAMPPASAISTEPWYAQGLFIRNKRKVSQALGTTADAPCATPSLLLQRNRVMGNSDTTTTDKSRVKSSIHTNLASGSYRTPAAKRSKGEVKKERSRSKLRQLKSEECAKDQKVSSSRMRPVTGVLAESLSTRRADTLRYQVTKIKSPCESLYLPLTHETLRKHSEMFDTGVSRSSRKSRLQVLDLFDDC